MKRNTHQHLTFVHWLLGGMLATSMGFAGCSSSEDAGNEEASGIGAVGLNLYLSEEVALDSIRYVITGPDAFRRSGTIDVSKSNTLTARIDGIPLGEGYTIELDADGRDDSATCSGSADFDVLSTGTTSVKVSLQCKLRRRNGSLLVNGSVNVCPTIEALDALPLEANLGGSIQLSAAGNDSDSQPEELTYTWSTSSGTLSDPNAASPTLTCTSAGPATVTLTVSDGDTCPDRQTVTVHCTISNEPITVAFQDGVSPGEDYAGTQDATIREAAPTTNYGNQPTCEADGDDGNGVDKSCLMRWDVSHIPAGSKVTSASLTVRVTSSTSDTYQFYAVRRAWDEAEVSWQHALTDTPWAESGASGEKDRGMTAIGSITGSTGTRTIELNEEGVALVQSWVDGDENSGIILASTSNTDGVDFVSSEGALAQRPRLTVTYVQSDGTGDDDGLSTEPNLKVAFIGDTGHGTNLGKVLELVVSEQAHGIMVQGDMSYSNDPDAWWDAVEAVVGPDFPIFLSRGNHDDATWPDYLPRAANHLGGAERIAGAHDAHYKTIWRGLVMATIRKGDGPERISSLLEGDPRIWKICQWHQNQQAMQIGGKSDEMGWGVYEACRELGAIIQTGHEHSYERTRTLTNTETQTVDSTCADPNEVCVGPGRTFVNVVGLGGQSIRPQLRCLPATFPYGCNQEWSFIYTSNQNATYGVQFITFNVDGKPNEADGYFKDIDGNVVDTFKVRADSPAQ